MKTITRTYKTVKNFMRYNGLTQFSMEQYKKGYIYNRGMVIRFRFTEEEDTRVRRLFAKAISSDRNYILYAGLISVAENYGIFSRVIISNDRGSIRSTYCAGQNYTGEVMYIRDILRRY